MMGAAKEIYVEEVMTKDPKTGSPDMSAQQAAKMMKREKVGSLVIMDGSNAIGILTEKDIVEKVVAEGRSATRTKVIDVMSEPLVTVGPKDTVGEVARKMSNMKLRRLPVVENGSLLGIVTENDILRLSPALIELTREYARLGECGPIGKAPATTSGYCENCSQYSDELIEHDGELLCRECYDQIRPRMETGTE
jgi:CBS domain-containing protein